MSNTVECSIDVAVPASTAYNQWTQFERFPEFMSDVNSVVQVDDRHLRWDVTINGVAEIWEAEITEQIPDKRIAWTSRTGTPNAGVITFHRLSDASCRIAVQVEYQPQGVIEHVGDFFGVVRRRIELDLERFRRFIEARSRETGAWRGDIRAPDERAGAGVR